MTGDYSRSTFKPKAQFDGVLMQQGRVQIDADWNEFVEILNDRDASRAVDIIGAVGAPRTTGGFDITPILTGAALYDLAISPGVLYVDGVRAVSDPTPAPVRVEPGNLSMTVGNWIVDGLPFQAGQQIAVPTQDGAPQILEIVSVTPETLTITVGASIVNPDAAYIVRTTTYLFQPNYRSQPFEDSAYAPTPPPLPQVTAGQGILAYLNVWQRMVTALDDPEIADPALNGADTAVRSQIVWQVDYDVVDIPPPAVQLESSEDDVSVTTENFSCTLLPDQTSSIVQAWQDSLLLQAADRGRMSALHQSLSASSLKNQLYRVQIQSPAYAKEPASAAATISGYEVTTVPTLDDQPWLVGQTISLTGTAAAGASIVLAEILNVVAGSTTATLTVDCTPGDVVREATSWTVQRAPTFLWSRDNASIAANLASLDGTEIIIYDDGRDSVTGFQGCQWIELTCDSLEEQGAPGIILQVKEVRGATISTILDYDELGMRLDMSAGWAVRRWDCPYTGLNGKLPPSVQGVLISLGEGVPIEDGISVDFEAAGLYSTGDYWWVVSRTNGERIEWPIDAFGPVKQHPVGIDRVYAQLAVVYNDGSWRACDLRPKFGQSIDFVDKTGDIMTGSLEIASGSSAPYSLVTSDPAYLNIGTSTGSKPPPITDPEAGLFVSGDVLAFKHENKNSFVGMLAPRLSEDKGVVEAGRVVLAGAGGDPTIIPRLDFSSSLNMAPLIRFEVTNQTADSPELTLLAPPALNTQGIAPQVTLYVIGNIYATGDIQGNHTSSGGQSVAELIVRVDQQANQIAELTRRLERLESAGGA